MALTPGLIWFGSCNQLWGPVVWCGVPGFNRARLRLSIEIEIGLRREGSAWLCCSAAVLHACMHAEQSPDFLSRALFQSGAWPVRDQCLCVVLPRSWFVFMYVWKELLPQLGT